MCINSWLPGAFEFFVEGLTMAKSVVLLFYIRLWVKNMAVQLWKGGVST